MSTVVSGLIEDDQAVISEELAQLVANLGKLDEQIAADRATLRMVTRTERLPDIRPEKHVVMVCAPSGVSGVVVDREWVAGS